MHLDVAVLREWLAETDAIRRLTDLFWAPYREHTHTESFVSRKGEYDEKLVSIEPMRITIAATDWPSCTVAQVRVSQSVYYDGGWDATFGARFNADGVMTAGELRTMEDGVSTDWPFSIPAQQPMRAGSVDFSELREWVATHNAVSKAIDGFWTYLRAYREEEPEDFRRDWGEAKAELFTLSATEIGLFRNLRWVDEDFVGIEVNVSVACDGAPIGRWDVDFLMSGEYDDDYWFPPRRD